MTTVLRGDAGRAGPDRAARLAAKDPASLVVSIDAAEESSASGTKDPVARIGVSIGDAALARRVMDAVTDAVREAARPPREVPVVRVRSRRGLERLRERIAGSIAVVPVTARNLRRAGEIVTGLRAAGALGVQLVWDGNEPPRKAAEARVFAILEEARATPGQAPVVLSRGEAPAEALRILVDRRC